MILWDQFDRYFLSFLLIPWDQPDLLRRLSRWVRLRLLPRLRRLLRSGRRLLHRQYLCHRLLRSGRQCLWCPLLPYSLSVLLHPLLPLIRWVLILLLHPLLL
jgi:hypothetical protein